MQHRGIHRLRHEEHALQVHRDDAVEFFLGVVFELLANVHAGVVEQDIDRAERCGGFGGEGAGGGDVRHIQRTMHRAAAERRDLGRRRVGLGPSSRWQKAMSAPSARRPARWRGRSRAIRRDQCDLLASCMVALPCHCEARSAEAISA